jgi:hypothetical protein
MGKLSDHQNIVTVFASAVTADRHPCIVMELCEGTYREDERLDIAEVIDVGAKLADALQAIHDAQVVHRDIKPHNIFVTKHGEPAIGDFGISSIENERTITGGAGFSIDYASPEVFEQGGASAPGDIYSLGATLYQLASGEVPFPHTGTPDEYLGATIHHIIATPPPSLQRNDAPPQLDRLLRRCMAKRSEDRPANAAAVANELRQMQLQVGVPTRDRRIERARATNAASKSRPPTSISAPPRTTAGRGDGATLARAGQVQAPVPPAAEQEDRAPTRVSRRLVVGVAIGALAVIGVLLAVALMGGGGEDADSTPTTSTTIAVADFVVLVPPEELRVERIDDRTYRLSWDAPQPDVTFQVTLVSTSENRIVDTTTYEWVIEGDATSPCFEVRSVGDGGRRVSQAATGPICADG